MDGRNSIKGEERAAIRIADFADRLGISVHTARTWAYGRKVASVKLGKLLYVPTSEVDRLISENLTPALPASEVR